VQRLLSFLSQAMMRFYEESKSQLSSRKSISWFDISQSSETCL